MSATTRSTAHRLGIMTIVAAMVAALLALVAVAPARAATPGDIVITEVMQNPSAVGDSAGEWFEVHNTTGAPIDLLGWTIRDEGADSHVIGSAVVVPPGGFVVLGNNADAGVNGGVVVDYEYGSSWFLSNSADEIAIDDASAVEIDKIIYDGGAVWPDPTGASMSLDPASTNSVANDDGGNWCEATTPYGAGDLGTPGSANTPCAGPPPPPPPSVSAGDVIVTEVMQNPAFTTDALGEWFEVYNTTGAAIDLDGWTIRDNDSDSFVVSSSVVVPAGGFAVFGNNGDSFSNGGATVDYVYAGMFLSNGADELVLEAPGPVLVDEILWDGGPVWPDPNGKSMTLDPTAFNESSNNSGSNWCEATSPFGDGDFGTPGAANDSCGLPPTTDPLINEYVVDHTGSDTHEFVEILGDAGADYSAFTILEIEGDTTSTVGAVDGVYPVGTTDGAGYWTTGFLSNGFENGTVTILLVEGFTGTEGDDLDSDNDGTFDTTPWLRIVDSVGVDEGGVAYGVPNLASGFDGIGFNVSGASRIPNGTDTDTAADWMRNHYFGAGLPTFSGTPSVGEAWNTPGAVNEAYVPAYVSVKIHDVQGSGATVAISGGVEVQGIVTALFEDNDVLEAFFVQEEDADVDADSATSEGIFVYCESVCPAPLASGDLVTVQGQAEEYFGMSQIDANDGGSVVIDSSGNALPTPIATGLPASGSTTAEATFESTEGMLVSFTDTLVVSEYFQLARFGQIVLTEDARPYQFTHDNAPSVGGYAAHLADLATRQIILDDDNNDNNDFISDGPDEIVYYPEGGLSTGNKFRGGDTIDGLTGVLHWSWAGGSGTDAWRIRPIPDVYDYSFDSVNPEPGAPADVGGDITVASFNVLNYFMTIDETSSSNSGPCGPSGSLDCRGADSEAERLRQRAKIVSALSAMNADIVGLVELENDGDDAAAADLVAGLNDALGAGTYAYISTGFIGNDAIKVGAIYKPGTVSPEGGFAILDSSVDPTFIDSKNRPSLIQTFSENATGEKLTIAVNHFKSKGSSCSDVGDPGLNDGQANCQDTRAKAATALVNYLATDPTGSGDDRFMILGDLNAYAKEYAIANLEAGGYTNLMAAFNGSDAYSYLFSAQLGYLDYALANDALLGSVTGVTEWHINADEVPLFDYNDDIRTTGEASFERESTLGSPYAPDALRSSDHDPVIVGLNLANPMGDKQDLLDDLNAMLPSGDDHTDKHLERAIKHLEHSLNPDYWTSDQTIDNKKVFDEEKKAVKELWRAVHHGILDATVAENAMDTLVAADELLARIALISAADRGVKQKDIDKAEEEMAKAAHYWADGNYSKAIDEYKKAWEKLNKKTHTQH